MTAIAKYTVYFVSTFMFIPAGRDIVAPGAAVMPAPSGDQPRQNT